MPGAFRLARRVQELPDGPVPEDLAAELKNPVPPMLGLILTGLFVFIVFLMVAQPDW